MKISINKGFIIPIMIAIVVLVLASGIYFVAMNKSAGTGNIGTINNVISSTVDWKTYTNSVYGFSFQYPADWIFSEPKDKVSFTVSAPKTMTVENVILPIYSITFAPIQTSAFSRQETKTGSIIYDPAKMTLLDIDSNPPRCLPVQDSSLSAPSIGYGGSMMSTPAHFESAILTNKDYMILVEELENDHNTTIDQIRSSFKFIGGVQVRLPDCSNTTTDNTTPTPVITSITPVSALAGENIVVKGNNLAGFEGDKNLWIKNSQGVRGIIYGDQGSTDKMINFKLADKYCTKDTSYSGLPCPSYLQIIPGNYQIYAKPWDKESNAVKFTVTSNNAATPTITIIEPNAGAVWKIGSQQNIFWNIDETIQYISWKNSKYQTYITLQPGDAPLHLQPASDYSYILTVPSSVCWGGDACETLKPGPYKIRVALYDDTPCGGLCPPDKQYGKWISYKDINVNITN